MLLEYFGDTKYLATDIYDVETNKTIYIKESKIHDEDHYWFTVTKKNIDNFIKYNVHDLLLTGAAGYYDIPIAVFNSFIEHYHEVPKNNKYHFHIYFKTHRLEHNKLNQINISEYFNELPEGRKYFSTNTNTSSIDIRAPKGNEEFVFEGINWYNRLIKKGDVIFFTQHGERPKWNPGLSAICEVTEEPYDLGYDIDVKKRKNFRIKLKPLLVLPRVLSRADFMGYFDCYDITFIGPTTKGEQNQAIKLLTFKKASAVSGVLLDVFPDLKNKLQALFGESFIADANKAELIIKNKNDAQDFSNITPNKIDESEPRNLILYGAPGTGKSYRLKLRAEGENTEKTGLFPDEWLRTRITFHPNYSYRNFVGSYKPTPLYKKSTETIYSSDTVSVNTHQKEPLIEYQFEPGPFLKMLIKAIKNPKYNFVIIIEEINRANTASVFGDIFQLLDRNEKGESEYSITLEPAAQDYLKINDIKDELVKIPSNLYLWATMNSADQGVMPLDSAFKRRWSFEHLGLNENNSDVNNIYINIPSLSKERKKMKWNDFRNSINKKLSDEGIHEDKLIGPFFLSKSEIISVKSIKNKLLLYLKEDVLRYKSCLFTEDLKTFSEISQAFENGKNIFSNDLSFILEDFDQQEQTETNHEHSRDIVSKL